MVCAFFVGVVMMLELVVLADPWSLAQKRTEPGRPKTWLLSKRRAWSNTGMRSRAKCHRFLPKSKRFETIAQDLCRAAIERSPRPRGAGVKSLAKQQYPG